MRDPHALARGLGEVLDDPALRAEWSTRGRALTAERYDWPGVALQVEALYREVLGDPAGAMPATPAATFLRRAAG